MSYATENERITQRTYGAIAGDWAKENNNIEYWRDEFEIFRSVMLTGRVLDVGCGYGRDYHFFRDAGYDYVGLDLCDSFLAEMEQLFPEAVLVKANMRSIPDLFDESSFDGFWAVASLLHIEKEDIGNVLQGIVRVVKDGGMGFISLKMGDGERVVSEVRDGWSAEDVRFFAYYQVEEFMRVLRKVGLRVIGNNERTSGNTTWLEFFVRCDKVEHARRVKEFQQVLNDANEYYRDLIADGA